MRDMMRVLAFLLLLLAFPFTANASDRLNVAVDHGTPLNLDTPATSVFVANPDVADVQVVAPTSIMVFGKRTGQTSLIVSDSNGHVLLQRTIMVTQNLDDLRLALNAILPGNKIRVNTVPNGIVLTGEAHDISMVEDAKRVALRYVPKDGVIIDRITVKGSNQIQIRVRFAEVSRDVDNRFGIDWQSLGNIGGFAFGLASGASVLDGANMASVLGVNRPTSGSNTNDVISLKHAGGHFNVNGLIDALAQNGLVTLLAEPNLTAMSGETASFLAGGEFPIPVPQSQSTTTIEWKNYGVSLAFTPTIVGEDRINMHVRPEVSQLTSVGAITLNSIVVPALTTRRAETTIELASGQSFAIGGLLNNDQTQTVNKYPFLGDMPILGALFRSSEFQNNQSELVIIITPYIVKPSDEQHLALPTDGFSPPSNTDQFFKARITNSDPDARTLSGKPQAAQVDAPSKTTESPVPEAAPIAPVTSTPAMSLPAQPSQPAGPGGFILE